MAPIGDVKDVCDRLAPLGWRDLFKQPPKHPARDELDAYANLARQHRQRNNFDARVTGPLIRHGPEWVSFVRGFEL